jgi:hypothetical protein
MTYGTPQDIAVVRRDVSDKDFREAIEYAPQASWMRVRRHTGTLWATTPCHRCRKDSGLTDNGPLAEETGPTATAKNG